MQRLRTAWRDGDRRFATSTIGRCLVLTLVLTVAATGSLHLQNGDHAAFAAAHSEQVATADLDAGDDCCPDHGDRLHGSPCGMASGCAFCAPLPTPVTLVVAEATIAEQVQETIPSGRVLSPALRPPKPFANV